MNIVENFTTTHLQLNWIDVLQVLNLFKTEDLNLSVFNMIAGIKRFKSKRAQHNYRNR